MLKALLLQLRVGNHQAAAHEMCRVAVAFGRAEPVEIGLLLLHRAVGYRIDSEPCAHGEPVLIRPGFDRRENDAGTVPAGKVEELVRSVSIRKILENVQQLHRMLFLDVERKL